MTLLLQGAGGYGPKSANPFSLSFAGVGSGDRVIVKSGGILAGNADWTISAFVLPSGITNDCAIYCERASSGNDILKMEIKASTKTLQVTYRDDAGTLKQIAGTTNLQDGFWHHVAVIKSGSSFTGYVDGLQNFTGTTTATNTLTNSLSSRIGSDTADAFAPFSGLLDEVTIYSSNVGIEGIQSLHQSVYPAGMAGQWLLDEGSGATTSDTSGNGNTGTITGATWSSNVHL